MENLREKLNNENIYIDCFPEEEHNKSKKCDVKKCNCYILNSQVAVSNCEAKLFCKVIQRLICEINHACDLNELAKVIEITNSFLCASASKEKSIASIINSTVPKSKDEFTCN